MNRIQYVEYDVTHSKDFIFNIPDGHECWLLILTNTPAEFYIDDEFKKYPPGCAVLYRPRQKICYRACSESYGNDWIRFFTDESYVTTTPIQCGIPFEIRDPDYCHKIFQLLTIEQILDNSYKDITIDNLLRILFNKLLESYNYRHASPLQRRLYELKMEIYRSPQEVWTVAKMAEKINISAGYLEEIYKKTFGVTCMDDVINSRINLAKKYLLYDQYSIAEIVSLCGYRNMEHFFRQFKKITGLTPKGFRSGVYDKNKF